MRIQPKDVYDGPDRYLSLLTAPSDRDFEGQNFDRKEACRPGPNGTVGRVELNGLRDQIKECVSAFANENKDGGLLVVGIASNGIVKGLKHLTEAQINEITNLSDILVHHTCTTKLHALVNEKAEQDAVALFLVRYAQRAICETVGTHPRAWLRKGFQNLPLSDADRDRLKRDKGIVDFERMECGPYAEDQVDGGAAKEFAENYLEAATYSWTTHRLLHHVGAIVGDQHHAKFTNAGSLFFGSNPQRELPYAQLRVLRFDVPLDQRSDRPPPTFDKSFDGSITKQIREFRTFLKESAFFKTYQRRRPDGGFTEEPELPQIAVDEAVVNAIAHRDYAVQIPILCEKYIDGLIVRSPGTLLQSKHLPEHFSLDGTRLEHLPRNPKLMEWLRRLRDPKGNPFVLAIQEGTRRMRDEMAALGLPAPEYEVSSAHTQVTLKSDAPRREAEALQHLALATTEFANLYPILGLTKADGREAARQRRQDMMGALRDKLAASGWFIDTFRFGLITAHRRGIRHPAPNNVARIVRLYPAVVLQVREYFGHSYLLVDLTTVVQSVLNVAAALDYATPTELVGLNGQAELNGWQRVRLLSSERDYCRVFLLDYGREETVPSNRLIPKLPRELIDRALRRDASNYDLPKEIKRLSLALETGAARSRAERTQAVVADLAASIFPLRVGTTTVELSTKPLVLTQRANGQDSLRVDGLVEPDVEFATHHSGPDIREGITRYGSFDHERKDIELVPVCAPDRVGDMHALIERLRSGKFKYKGAERTFSTRLTYRSVAQTATQGMEEECRRLLHQYPEWHAANGWPRLFLVHCPEEDFPIDDESAPYYRIKRMLFEAGIPCQMVDTPTLRNPDFKDLNLALNVVAKCGVTPWVLPGTIADADFFIGLSYTQSIRNQSARIMGFANVFNEYGRWEFYSGGGETFTYDERADYYERLVEDTLKRLPLSERPSIWFHYSAKFSRDDRVAILRGARKVRPFGTYSFAWINRHHNARFYDSRVETDGSLARGRYVIGSANQIYISTTGHNAYRKVLGTPHVLEVNIHIERPETDARSSPDLRALAGQILSLTKLNWASTDSLCAEPITTKYAGDIAYLTAAFMRQGGQFKLHPVLEKTPWFI